MLNSITPEFYSHSNKRLSKLSNLYEISSTVQVVCSPLNSKLGDGTFIVGSNSENVPFVLSAGNDMTIRYWDITKEGLNSNSKRSYLVNCPNKIDTCLFSTSNFNNTVIIQSNESVNTKLPKKDVPFFSEYQNYNGVSFNLGIQNEFDESLDVLKYCNKISDCSHQNVITDLMSMNLYGTNNVLLFSSSWDGTIKIWK